ncbi:PEP/pyruvate-binding domain-containing protein, partial [Pontibacterium sp.]|uniref:PEP/pyruvate-binding domain-containing protein n=1 Tax=Pontibacterium sp. TaxID=2036026 RepID=UPI003566C205
MQDYVLRLDQVGMNDVETVGGKNASLGEMISQLSNAGVKVPNGFATTALAFRDFLQHGGLEEKINETLTALDTDNVIELADTGKMIRGWIMDAPFQPALNEAIEGAFVEMCGDNTNLSVAVRSSATAEDLPDASFAGQQETFLNIRGLDNVKHAIKEVFASLYNDRAISYRVHQGFDHSEVALSA